VGLDMNLYAKEKMLSLHGYKTAAYSNKVMVISWSKANQIHNFFVDNCGGGFDVNQEMKVEREKLKELLKLCKYIIEHPEEAEQKLPTKSGFHFGSIEYNQRYYDDLEFTVESLDKVLNNDDFVDFTYQASW